MRFRGPSAKASGADILLTTGGASVGDHDLVQAALKEAGIRLDFWKIALRPGKPLMFARDGRRRILGLPGNPVSALVCARIFLKPLIFSLLGLPTDVPDTVKARLGMALAANDLRQDYLRAKVIRGDDGSYRATPFTVQDSSMQRALTEAQGLIVRPPLAPAGARRRSRGPSFYWIFERTINFSLPNQTRTAIFVLYLFRFSLNDFLGTFFEQVTPC